MARKKLDKFTEATQDLNQKQLLRFQLLFDQQKSNAWMLPVAFTGLGAYALIAGMLLNPAYSWVVVLMLALFVVFFIRSLTRGIIGEAKKKTKDYGLIILPLILTGLFLVCGILIWNHNNNETEHQKYREKYQACQQTNNEPYCPLSFEDYTIDNYQQNKDQIRNGIALTGLSLIVIYPLALYYSKSLTDKRNQLLAVSLADQVKAKTTKNKA